MQTELAVHLGEAPAARQPFGRRAALRSLEQAESDHRDEVRATVEGLAEAERAYQREVARRTEELAAAGRHKLIAGSGALLLYELELATPDGRIPLTPGVSARVRVGRRHVVFEIGATSVRLRRGRDVESLSSLRWFVGLVNSAAARIDRTQDRIATRVACARERLAEALLDRESVEQQAAAVREAVASARLQESCEEVAGGYGHGPQAEATLARVRATAALGVRLRESVEHELARVEADSALARVSAGRLLDGSAH